MSRVTRTWRGGSQKVTSDDEGEGGGQETPQKWWRHLWTAPKVMNMTWVQDWWIAGCQRKDVFYSFNFQIYNDGFCHWSCWGVHLQEWAEAATQGFYYYYICHRFFCRNSKWKIVSPRCFRIYFFLIKPPLPSIWLLVWFWSQFDRVTIFSACKKGRWKSWKGKRCVP